MNTLKVKQYLGDSVYVRFEHGDLILTTENGSCASNTIVLEPQVYENLKTFIERIIRLEVDNHK